MYVQGVENVYDLDFNGADGRRAASPMATSSCRPSANSRPTISSMPTPTCCSRHFADAESECDALLDSSAPLALPAYDQCMKASHLFNLLDARGVISVTERAGLYRPGARARQGLLRGLAREPRRKRGGLSHGRTPARAVLRGNPRAHAGAAPRDDLKRLVDGQADGGRARLHQRTTPIVDAAPPGAASSTDLPRAPAGRARRSARARASARREQALEGFLQVGRPRRASTSASSATPARANSGSRSIAAAGPADRRRCCRSCCPTSIAGAALAEIDALGRPSAFAGCGRCTRSSHVRRRSCSRARSISAVGRQVRRARRAAIASSTPSAITVASFADYEAKLRDGHVIARSGGAARADRGAGATSWPPAEGLTVKPDDGAARRGDGPGRMAGRADRRASTQQFMDAAARGADHRHAHAPEIFLAARPGRQAGAALPRRRQHRDRRTAARPIVAGNERVLRARLSDAKFFWDQDRKVTARRAACRRSRSVVFHAKLGTVARQGRAHRGAGRATCAAAFPAPTPTRSRRAALLAKADLVDRHGRRVPRAAGRHGPLLRARTRARTPAVADAIAEHYTPLGPNDRCPTAPVSVAVALADKIDTLVGFFAIGEKPTGSKDPFALRRAALGVIRLILENELAAAAAELSSHAALNLAVCRAGTSASPARRSERAARLSSPTG